MEDSERSAFGLGWEHARRRNRLVANPFAEGTLRWQMYRDGFKAYQDQPPDYETKLAARQR